MRRRRNSRDPKRDKVFKYLVELESTLEAMLHEVRYTQKMIANRPTLDEYAEQVLIPHLASIYRFSTKIEPLAFQANSLTTYKTRVVDEDEHSIFFDFDDDDWDED